MDVYNQNNLIALVVIIVVMIAMKIFHKERFKDNSIKMILFAAIYLFFLYALNKYGIEEISILKWLTLTTILYMTLDDILHREFNLLGALFVIIANFFLEENYFILYSSAVIIVTILVVWVISKARQKAQKGTIGGMSSGDPWLIVAFISFFQITELFELLMMTWIVVVIAFVIQAIRKKAKDGLPLAPLMMVASIITYL